jgi:Protein of unknown function DUF262
MQNEENDLDFDDQYSPEEDSTEIPTEVRKINTQAYDKSVSDVVRMINDGEINLNPEYQRNYIWDNKRASLLVESIILNVPIPVIYVSQEDDDTWTVIDGLQRLNSLKRYFDRDFKLTGLEILAVLNKSDIKSLNPKALRVLRNGLLRIIVIANDSHPEIKYDVFMRLNRGSVKLTEQELRNCLYRGKLNETLKSLAENKSILTLLNLKAPHNRMMDCELILRYLALVEKWDIATNEINGYKGKMKNFLNEYMYSNQNPDKKFISKNTKEFEETTEKVLSVYGGKAFRRLNEEGEYETSLNRSIMDILMTSSAYFSKSELEGNKEKIIERLEYLILNDLTFRNSVTISTSDTKVITYRLKRWYDEVNSIVNG